MDATLLFLTALHGLALCALIGGVYSVLLAGRRARRGGWGEGWRGIVAQDRALQARGAVHGPLMAVVIFSGLGLYYLKTGGFHWGRETPWGAWHLAKIGLFLPVWLHWGWHEVVVMDALRKRWPAEGASALPDGYRAGHRRVYRSLRLLALGLTAVFVVGVGAGLLGGP